MKNLFLSSFFLVLSTAIFAQAFEGVIEFKKLTTTDTINYVYYVKGAKVRIDEIGSIVTTCLWAVVWWRQLAKALSKPGCARAECGGPTREDKPSYPCAHSSNPTAGTNAGANIKLSGLPHDT